jgi:hypothetical protein
MLDNAAGQESTQNQETILTANTNDQATPEDHLGFEPYVNAVADFLTNKDTHPPLVLSIEGEWGTGKTSFMLQLQKALRDRGQRFTVWFNPWRHDKEDALWAAFALEFTRGIAKCQSFLRRWLGHLRLFALRFQWREGWLSLVQKVSVWLLILIATIALGVIAILNRGVWTQGLAGFAKNVLDLKEGADVFAQSLSAGGLAAYIALLLTVLNRIRSFLGDPLSIDLKKYIQAPNYEERVSFVERFHEDFERILSAYAGRDTVYVFIDDVDRCEVPKAADLMSALNLMITGNTRIIFIIGMDREKVAAGLAVKHEKLLPYLYASRHSAPEEAGKSQPDIGLEYGYEFIEKFVQLPFLLPRPDDKALEKFLRELSEPPLVAVGKRNKNTSSRAVSDVNTSEQVDASDLLPDWMESLAPQEEDLSTRQSVIVQAGVDSPRIHEIIRLVAPAFDNNPRRLKQYINLFRLRVFIAAATGLFDHNRDSQYPALTLEQLGKFVAIILRWPLLLAQIENVPGLLADLQKLAVEPPQADDPKISRALRYWMTRWPDLMPFLAKNVTREDVDTSAWSLSRVDVPHLLQVLPKVRNVSAPLPAPKPPVAKSRERLGPDQPVSQTMSTYVLGDDLYDDSFSIDAPDGEFLGEYGIGISETIGVGEPKKAAAFEAWMFDKNDIRTTTKVLLSPHAYKDPNVTTRLQAKGDVMLAERGNQYLLETETLQAVVTIVDMQYGGNANLPAESYFERISFEFAVWRKNVPKR